MGIIEVKAFCPNCRCEMIVRASEKGDVRFYDRDSLAWVLSCPDCGADLRGVTREELITQRNWP